MRYSKILFLGVFFVFVGLIQAKDATYPASKFKPSWAVGQTWQIEIEKFTEPKSKPGEAESFVPRKYKVIQKFKVERLVDLDNELCYQIRIESISVDGKPLLPERFCRLFMRKSDNTLKAIQRLYRRKKEENVEHVRFYEVGPVIGPSSAEFGFPFFDAPEREYVPKRRIGRSKDDKTIRAEPNRSHQKFESSVCIVDGKEDNAGLFTLQERGQTKQPARISTVKKEVRGIWAKGLPWWSYAVSKIEGREKSWIRLITVNGKKTVSNIRNGGI